MRNAALLLAGMALFAVPAEAGDGDPLAPLSEAEATTPAAAAPPPPAPTKPAARENAQPTAPAAQATQPAPAPATPIVVQVPKNWRAEFDAIRARDWAAVEAGLTTLPDSPLRPVARAEYYTAKGSPPVSLEKLLALIAESPDLPQAEQLARMAISRGATTPPAYVQPNRLVALGAAPGRRRGRPVSGEPAANELRVALDPLVAANDAAGAEALLVTTGPLLSYEARAEAGQRVAWTYYRIGQDAEARRVADTWRAGSTGDSAVQWAWLAALASWRLADWEAASRNFREVAASAADGELQAAAYYWAARSEQACRRPQSVAPLLKAAARSPESFYGLLARETLGMDKQLPPDLPSRRSAVESLPNVRRALELIRIGEIPLAEEMIRYQARIGPAADHHGLIEFARQHELAGAQFWLAHNGPAGARSDPGDRYPTPSWRPATGWRIDPALAFAHIIQESTFRREAVSQAGAVGLMQVIPGTAADMAGARGLSYSRSTLTDPAQNLEYGQSFIERIRAMTATRGELPRVIAAYNAGPTPVERWLYIADRGDPLLWIESIPYWETRFYVPAVLRNMWVYQARAGADTPTLKAMAQHRWPAFPTTRTNFASAMQKADGTP